MPHSAVQVQPSPSRQALFRNSNLALGQIYPEGKTNLQWGSQEKTCVKNQLHE